MPDPAEHSHDTYEVTGGKLHHVNERGERETLTKGRRFNPTIRQVESGSLEGKATRVATGGPRTSVTVDVEFDEDGNIVREEETVEAEPESLDALTWGSDPALDKARDAGLTVEEMKAVGSTGATGFVTADVRRALEARE